MGESFTCRSVPPRLLAEPDVSSREGATEAEKHRDLMLARVRALMHFSEESEVRGVSCMTKQCSANKKTHQGKSKSSWKIHGEDNVNEPKKLLLLTFVY